ncbi:NUDIX hydrolase [Geminicoccaceae bacterium 1502E]|nr:NUDIX hydrolase [Geminicoccaceae bacterium 1502E]
MTRDYPDRPLVGVGAVVWRDGQVLLVRRGKPPRLGQWSLPGGAQELGETVEEAARREVREETGLELGTVSLLTVVDLIERGEDGRVHYHYTLVDVEAEAGQGEAVAASDAAAVGWFGSDALAALPLWEETRRVIALSAARRCSGG